MSGMKEGDIKHNAHVCWREGGRGHIYQLHKVPPYSQEHEALLNIQIRIQVYSTKKRSSNMLTSETEGANKVVSFRKVTVFLKLV